MTEDRERIGEREMELKFVIELFLEVQSHGEKNDQN